MKIRITLTRDFEPVNTKVSNDNEITAKEIQEFLKDYENTLRILQYGTLTIEEIYDEEISDDGIVTTRSKLLHNE